MVNNFAVDVVSDCQRIVEESCFGFNYFEESEVLLISVLLSLSLVEELLSDSLHVLTVVKLLYSLLHPFETKDQ